MCGDPFTATGITHLFGGRSLDIYAATRHLTDFGQVGDHLGDVGRQLGALGDDRGVKIADPVFPGLRQANNMFK